MKIAMIHWIAALTVPLCVAAAHGQVVVVIGNPSVKKVDAISVLRIYMGRTSEIEGNTVYAANAPTGSSVRNRFLATCLQQDENRYTAHWTVRKYVGKGTSPREFTRGSDVLNFVGTTPGAIGYLDESEVGPGVNVLMRCGIATSQSPIGYIVDRIVSQLSRILH